MIILSNVSRLDGVWVQAGFIVSSESLVLALLKRPPRVFSFPGNSMFNCGGLLMGRRPKKMFKGFAEAWFWDQGF